MNMRRGPKPSEVESPKTEFGRLFSKLRVRAGFSTQDLSEAVGYHSRRGGSANIGKYERGEMLPPVPEVLMEWMVAMGYQQGSVEVNAVLRAAMEDHCQAIREAYGRYL